MKTYYSDAYPETRCGLNEPRIRAALPLVGTGHTILDAGCLDGTVAEAMLRAGNTVHGIDACSAAVEKASAKGIAATVGDLEQPLPYADSTFDLVFAGEVIEHLFAVGAFLAECRRVLRPGGRIIVTTPNLASMARRLFLLAGLNPQCELSERAPAAGHIRYYVPASLRSLLRSHGFTVTRHVSDVVSFSGDGKAEVRWLAQLCPSIGRALIMEARKDEPS